MTTTNGQMTLPSRRAAGGWTWDAARRLISLLLPRREALSDTETVQLRDQATLELRTGLDELALRCRSGLFVVTQERDPVDHELEPGDEFRSTARGLVVAWAIRGGVLEVSRRR